MDQLTMRKERILRQRQGFLEENGQMIYHGRAFIWRKPTNTKKMFASGLIINNKEFYNVVIDPDVAEIWKKILGWKDFKEVVVSGLKFTTVQNPKASVPDNKAFIISLGAEISRYIPPYGIHGDKKKFEKIVDVTYLQQMTEFVAQNPTILVESSLLTQQRYYVACHIHEFVPTGENSDDYRVTLRTKYASAPGMVYKHTVEKLIRIIKDFLIYNGESDDDMENDDHDNDFSLTTIWEKKMVITVRPSISTAYGTRRLIFVVDHVF